VPSRKPPRQTPSGLETLNSVEGIALYTDGSAWSKDRSGGWAWLAVDAFDGEAYNSGGESATTNNRMEMMAWIEGLISIYEGLGPAKLLVYSDSEYVGYGATRPGRLRKRNNDLWDVLDEAVRLHEYMEFVYVKGHSGHLYNERVDQMAGQARVEWRDASESEPE
jgi:ribonuclease HI